MKIRISLPSLVAGAALGLVLAGGSAYAVSQVTGADILDGSIEGRDIATSTITASDVAKGTLSGTHVVSNGLTGIDIAPESLEGSDIRDYSLSNQDIGVLRASVRADGSVASGSSGVTVKAHSPGHYAVGFSRDVRSCTATATVRTTFGLATVSNGWSEPSTIYVNTYDVDAGKESAHEFNVVVVC